MIFCARRSPDQGAPYRQCLNTTSSNYKYYWQYYSTTSRTPDCVVLAGVAVVQVPPQRYNSKWHWQSRSGPPSARQLRVLPPLALASSPSPIARCRPWSAPTLRRRPNTEPNPVPCFYFILSSEPAVPVIRVCPSFISSLRLPRARFSLANIWTPNPGASQLSHASTPRHTTLRGSSQI